ncbi:MAG: PEP-utilizing enzyme, partial [Candidatus Omnitrophica bacterium]|nr:PEP-utilizing enzyme [Candidatus Omnitrophota bacterium]
DNQIYIILPEFSIPLEIAHEIWAVLNPNKLEQRRSPDTAKSSSSLNDPTDSFWSVRVDSSFYTTPKNASADFEEFLIKPLIAAKNFAEEFLGNHSLDEIVEKLSYATGCKLSSQQFTGNVRISIYSFEGRNKDVFKVEFELISNEKIEVVLAALKQEKSKDGITLQELDDLEYLDLVSREEDKLDFIPKLIYVHRSTSKDDRTWYIEEFIPGPTAYQLLNEGKLTFEERKRIIEILLALLEKLDAMPRDIHGKNFIIDENKKRVVFVDLGQRRIMKEKLYYDRQEALSLLILLVGYYGDKKVSNRFIFELVENKLGTRVLSLALNYANCLLQQNNKDSDINREIDKVEENNNVDKHKGWIKNSEDLQIFVKDLTDYLSQSKRSSSSISSDKISKSNVTFSLSSNIISWFRKILIGIMIGLSQLTSYYPAAYNRSLADNQDYVETASDNNDVERIYEIGKQLREEGRYDEAIKFYRNSKYASHSKIIKGIISAYAQKGDFTTALDELKEKGHLLSLEDRRDVYFNIGISFQNKEIFDRALEYFEKASELNDKEAKEKIDGIKSNYMVNTYEKAGKAANILYLLYLEAQKSPTDTGDAVVDKLLKNLKASKYRDGGTTYIYYKGTLNKETEILYYQSPAEGREFRIKYGEGFGIYLIKENIIILITPDGRFRIRWEWNSKTKEYDFIIKVISEVVTNQTTSPSLQKASEDREYSDGELLKMPFEIACIVCNTKDFIRWLQLHQIPSTEDLLNEITTAKKIVKEFIMKYGSSYNVDKEPFIFFIPKEIAGEKFKRTIGLCSELRGVIVFLISEEELRSYLFIDILHELLHYYSKGFSPYQRLEEGMTAYLTLKLVGDYCRKEKISVVIPEEYPNEQMAIHNIIATLDQFTHSKELAEDIFIKAYLRGDVSEIEKILGKNVWERITAIATKYNDFYNFGERNIKASKAFLEEINSVLKEIENKEIKDKKSSSSIILRSELGESKLAVESYKLADAIEHLLLQAFDAIRVDELPWQHRSFPEDSKGDANMRAITAATVRNFAKSIETIYSQEAVKLFRFAEMLDILESYLVDSGKLTGPPFVAYFDFNSGKIIFNLDSAKIREILTQQFSNDPEIDGLISFIHQHEFLHQQNPQIIDEEEILRMQIELLLSSNYNRASSSIVLDDFKENNWQELDVSDFANILEKVQFYINILSHIGFLNKVPPRVDKIRVIVKTSNSFGAILREEGREYILYVEKDYLEQQKKIIDENTSWLRIILQERLKVAGLSHQIAQRLSDNLLYETKLPELSAKRIESEITYILNGIGNKQGLAKGEVNLVKILENFSVVVKEDLSLEDVDREIEALRELSNLMLKEDMPDYQVLIQIVSAAKKIIQKERVNLEFALLYVVENLIKYFSDTDWHKIKEKIIELFIDLHTEDPDTEIRRFTEAVKEVLEEIDKRIERLGSIGYGIEKGREILVGIKGVIERALSKTEDYIRNQKLSALLAVRKAFMEEYIAAQSSSITKIKEMAIEINVARIRIMEKIISSYILRNTKDVDEELKRLDEILREGKVEGINIEEIRTRIINERKRASYILFDYLRKGNGTARVIYDLISKLEPIIYREIERKEIGVVLVIEDNLTFGEIVRLMTEFKIVGIVSDRGAQGAHWYIFAKELGIPVVLEAKGLYDTVKGGELICIDSQEGVVILNPTKEDLEGFEAKIKDFVEKTKILNSEATGGIVEVYGSKIPVGINVSGLPFTEAVANADGIFLVRTEFLYEDRLPNKEELIEFFIGLASIIDEIVIIRVFDRDKDKRMEGVPNSQVVNSFGLEFAFDFAIKYLEEFLEAFLIAARQKDNLRLLVPMISNKVEVDKFFEIFRDVVDRLGIDFDKNKVGAMVETEAAVINIEYILQHFGFISLGTNDLIASIHNVDRQDSSSNKFYQNPSKELKDAVLKVMDSVKEFNTKSLRKINICVCGDMATNEEFILFMTREALRRNLTFSLSVPHRDLARIKNFLRRINKEDLSTVEAGTIRDIIEEELESVSSIEVRVKYITGLIHFRPATDICKVAVKEKARVLVDIEVNGAVVEKTQIISPIDLVSLLSILEDNFNSGEEVYLIFYVEGVEGEKRIAILREIDNILKKELENLDSNKLGNGGLDSVSSSSLSSNIYFDDVKAQRAWGILEKNQDLYLQVYEAVKFFYRQKTKGLEKVVARLFNSKDAPYEEAMGELVNALWFTQKINYAKVIEFSMERPFESEVDFVLEVDRNKYENKGDFELQDGIYLVECKTEDRGTDIEAVIELTKEDKLQYFKYPRVVKNLRREGKRVVGIIFAFSGAGVVFSCINQFAIYREQIDNRSATKNIEIFIAFIPDRVVGLNHNGITAKEQKFVDELIEEKVIGGWVLEADIDNFREILTKFVEKYGIEYTRWTISGVKGWRTDSIELWRKVFEVLAGKINSSSSSSINSREKGNIIEDVLRKYQKDFVNYTDSGVYYLPIVREILKRKGFGSILENLGDIIVVRGPPALFRELKEKGVIQDAISYVDYKNTKWIILNPSIFDFDIPSNILENPELIKGRLTKNIIKIIIHQLGALLGLPENINQLETLVDNTLNEEQNLQIRDYLQRKLPPYSGDMRASSSLTSRISSPLSLSRKLPLYNRGELGASVAASSSIVFFMLLTLSILGLYVFAGTGIIGLLKIVGILSSITVLGYAFLATVVLHIVLAFIMHFRKIETTNNILKIQSVLFVFTWLTLWTIITYFITPLGWFKMPILGHLLTAAIGFGSIAVLTVALAMVSAGAYNVVYVGRMNIEELYRAILALDKEGKVTRSDLENLNLRELRKLYAHLLSIGRKTFRKGEKINTEGWFGDMLKELADSRIGLAVEFAISLDEAIQLVSKITSKMGIFAMIFKIPIALIVAPIYFILRVTILFFSRFSLMNVKFLQSYNNGEIKLNSLKSHIEAFKKQNRKQKVLGEIRYIWNLLVLRHPILGGILEFIWSRLTLAIVSGIIAHPLAALTGLEGMVGLFLWIYSLLPQSIEGFFIQHLLPTYTNLLSILILSALLSLKTSLKNIRHAYLEIFVAPKFGLSTFNIEMLIDKINSLKELYRQGYLYTTTDSYLGNLIDERGISLRGYLKISFDYLALLPLYIFNTFIPFGLVFKGLGLDKQYLIFASVLNRLRWGFWSSTLGLATIGLEIGAAQTLATYTGGPLETLIGPWEGSSTYPYPILGVGNYIISTAENYLDLERQFESGVFAPIFEKVKEVNKREIVRREIYWLKQLLKQPLDASAQGRERKEIDGAVRSFGGIDRFAKIDNPFSVDEIIN